MNKLLLFCLIGFLLVLTTTVSGQIKSGPIIAVSAGWLEKGHVYGPSYGTQYGAKDGKWNSQINFQVGYQFLFPLKNNFAINTSLLYTSRGVHVAYNNTFEDKVDESKRFNAISVNAGINYYIIGKIPLGVGLEPTYYLNTKVTDNLMKNTLFDVPLVLKAGYNFGKCELILSYKQGFKSLYRNHLVGKATSRDIQLSVFVPLFFLYK